MNGPTFRQEYTDAIRRFNLSDEGVELSIDWLSEWTDAAAMHRRDFNVFHRS